MIGQIECFISSEVKRALARVHDRNANNGEPILHKNGQTDLVGFEPDERLEELNNCKEEPKRHIYDEE
jgi:hypothetical protein